jgi:hypothetical protein
VDANRSSRHLLACCDGALRVVVHRRAAPFERHPAERTVGAAERHLGVRHGREVERRLVFARHHDAVDEAAGRDRERTEVEDLHLAARALGRLGAIGVEALRRQSRGDQSEERDVSCSHVS